MSDVLLALDLGTNLGWAYGRPDAMMSGSVDLKPTHFENSGTRVAKFLAFMDTLHLSLRIGALTAETALGSWGAATAPAYAEMLARLPVWCLRRGVNYLAPDDDTPPVVDDAGTPAGASLH